MEMEIDEYTMEVLFTRFDEDRSGTIDYAEFSKLCLYLGVGTQETADEKRKLVAECDRVEASIPRYLGYLGGNHIQVAEMCEYCSGLMHRLGRLTDSLKMTEQAQRIRRSKFAASTAEPGQAHQVAPTHKFVDDD